MELEVLRFNDNGDSTNGLLFDISNGERKFLCYTLEDEGRQTKVYGETRIPEGKYCIGWRTVGGFNAKYAERFSDIHVGMLEVMDVPGFTYILIHCGNDDEDTAGCLLVGDTQSNNNSIRNGFIGKSVAAYKKLYTNIALALESGEDVTIEYKVL